MALMRFTLVAVLAALAAGATGCSNSGGDAPAVGGLPLHLSPPAQFARAGVKITEFADLPQDSGDEKPTAIASGPKKSLWVTETMDPNYGENAVVQIATSGKALNAFYYSGITSGGANFMGITTGRDGALWITDFYNKQILQMTTSGRYTGYALDVAPLGIVAGPDKALWFTARGVGKESEIGRVTTAGNIAQFAASGGVYGITVGPDKALWYTEKTGNAIGRITTKGKITEFTKGISSGAYPFSIAAGPDGALWFTEYKGGRIGRITTDGKVTEYSRGITPGEKPVGIAAGPDGVMWFTESQGYYSGSSGAAKIGSITMSGKVTEYSNGLTATSYPTAIVQGPDHDMWFVETSADKLGRVDLSGS